MAKYIIERLVADVLSLFILITIMFLLMHITPKGPFSPSEQRNMPEEVLEQISEKYGLSDPLPAQYVRYPDSLLHGDMGTSFKKQDTTVNEPITNGFPVPTKVGALGIAVALAARISLGIVAAVKRGKLTDGVSIALVTIDVSVPSSVPCALVMYIFCEKWKVFPPRGLTSWKHYMLPVSYMVFSQMAYITRLMRSSMLKTMRQNYIRTECSKGVLEREIISKYALKNFILPVVAYVGPLVVILLTDTFIIEKLFNIPGLGRYFISAVTDGDYSITLGPTVFLSVTITGCSLIVNIMCAVIGPEVRIME